LNKDAGPDVSVFDRPSKLSLSISNLNKTFRRENGKTVTAIDNASLNIEHGEFVVLLGPSGCGKTTLLRAVAGLERPDTGTISLGEKSFFDSTNRIDLPPEDRHIGMVFQSYALWPHMTVAQNVGYPMRMRGVGKADRYQRVEDILSKMRIGDLAHQYPGSISGGQQQRVALARALVCGDPLILFDEPLSNVDAKVREHLRFEILTMQRTLGFTALYVTHDQEEAMALASRIAVVNQGRVQQFGTPEDIYTRPVSLDVARFIGTAIELTARVVEPGVIDTAAGRLHVEARLTAGHSGGDVTLLTRPEHWHFSESEDANALPGHVVSAAFLGPYTEHVVRLKTVSREDIVIIVRGSRAELRPPGSAVTCSIRPHDPLIFR
jgi:iron(III) transport system ATP-binding protein